MHWHLPSWARWSLALAFVLLAFPLGLGDGVPPFPPLGNGVPLAKTTAPPGPAAQAPVRGRLVPHRRGTVFLAPGRLWVPHVPFDLPADRLPSTLEMVRQDVGPGVTPAEFSEPFRTTAQIYSTPFGHDLHLNLYLSWQGSRVALSLWNQVNGAAYFPGFDVQLVEMPLSDGPHPILLTPRFGLWAQPTSQADGILYPVGALASVILEVPVEDDLWFWVEGQEKAAGWVPGIDTLAATFNIRTGLHWNL